MKTAPSNLITRQNPLNSLQIVTKRGGILGAIERKEKAEERGLYFRHGALCTWPIESFNEKTGSGYASDHYEECPKCHGEGGWSGGPGYTCFKCEGAGRVYVRGLRVYTQEKLDKLNATAEKKRLVREEKRAAELQAKKDASGQADFVETLRGYGDDFLESLVSQFDDKGGLSPKQLAAAEKALERLAARKAEQELAIDVPEGRQEITGVVLSTRVQDGRFGTERKMLVQCDGFKLWGSVPKSLYAETAEDCDEGRIFRTSELEGRTVRLTATLSGKERGFGFFSRPSKAQLLED